MKAEIKLESNYGFGMNWILVCSTPKITKTFWLGQDVKFCNRVLGMGTDYVVKAIGTRNIDEGTVGNRRLARYICDRLEINGNNIKRIPAWGLACQ